MFSKTSSIDVQEFTRTSYLSAYQSAVTIGDRDKTCVCL